MPRTSGPAALAIAFALLAFAVGPVRATTTPPAIAQYGDWTVACDNAGECTAVSVSFASVMRARASDPGDYAVPKLWIKRSPGAASPPRIFVDTTVWGTAESGPELWLHIYYGRETDPSGRAYWLRQIEPGRHEMLPAVVAGFFAESTRTARAATRLDGGRLHGIISTDGLVAAMRHIDQAQGRTGTVTAIYARGRRPASQVPDARARPVVRVVRGDETEPLQVTDPPELMGFHHAHCQGPPGPPIGPDIQQYALTSGQKLWGVSCSDNPHAEKRLWLVEGSDGRIAMLPMPRPDAGGRSDPPILPNSDFDPVSGQITGSSGGLCGWRRRWAWTGTAFAMIDSIEMPACIDILPHQWLQTYRAVPE